MKNLKNRKIRNHHRLIATLRDFGTEPMPITVLKERFQNVPEADNLLVRPNAWAQFAIKNEDAVIVLSTRGTKDQTYTLKNAFAFDDTGRRFTNAEGTRFLTDEEILSGVENIVVNTQTSEPELTHEDVLRNLASNTDIILATSIFGDDEVVTDEMEESIVFHVSVDPVVDDNEAAESETEESNDEPEIVDYTAVADMSFDMGNSDVPAFVAEKPKPVRHIDPNTGKFCSRARAIELGLITAEAA